MGTISVLKTAKVEPGMSAQDYGRSGASPVSLLAFLQAENVRLRKAVTQLRRDTTALRESLQDN
jgi:hypothetical protein